MPEDFDPAWEYWEPDPEVQEFLSEQVSKDTIHLPSMRIKTRVVFPERFCETCRKAFFPTSKETTHCSRSCGNTRKGSSGSENCPVCGCEIRPASGANRDRKKYCTQRCMKIAAYRRYRSGPVSLEDAKQMIIRGVEYGTVYVLLKPEHQKAFKEWYLNTPELPNLEARRAKQPPPSGNPCKRCGGMLIRDGKCERCTVCNEIEGSCS